MPGNSGASGDGALEAFAGQCFAVSRQLAWMRIKNQQDAEIVLAREFTDHQRAGAGGGFPMHVAGAVCGNVFAQSVQILAPPLVIALDAAIDAGKNFAELRIRFDAGIDQSFGFQSDAAGLLQESKRKSRHDFESVLDMQTAFQKRDGNALLHVLLARKIRKKDRSFQQSSRRRILGNDGFDAQGERWQRQLAVDEFHLSANCLSGENVFGKADAQLNTSEGNGRKNSRHQNNGYQTGEDEEQKIVAGVQGGESHQQRCAEVQPAGAADFVFNFLSDPAKRCALGQRGYQGDGYPSGNCEGQERGAGGYADVAKFGGGAGVDGEEKRYAEGRDGKEEGADGGAVGFGPELHEGGGGLWHGWRLWRSWRFNNRREIPRRSAPRNDGALMLPLRKFRRPWLERDADGVYYFAQGGFGGFGFFL